MAERRMFAKTIVLSDAFLDMPLSARCLYFTLGMFADDDGFVNNPKAIMRQCGASNDDMLVLLSKKYLLEFETGVVVIKHWRINNYLRNDRYNPTKYEEEKKQLVVNDNGSYSFGIPNIGIPSIGKDRLDKDSIDKVNNIPNGILESTSLDDAPTSPEKSERVNYQEIINLYNTICLSYPRIKSLSEARKKAIRARLKSYKVDSFKTLFEKAEASDFLKGANNRNWSATFDWLLKDSNMAKVLDGNYDNSNKNYQGGSSPHSVQSKPVDNLVDLISGKADKYERY